MENKRGPRRWLRTWQMVLLAGLFWIGGRSPWLCCRQAQADPPVEPAGSFLIPAYAYDRGVNVETCISGYADAEPMVGNRRYPTQIEYDVEFPVSAEYSLHMRYAAHTARPVELLLDGKRLGLCCRTATGGWKTSKAAWEETCKVSVARGRHTVKLSCEKYFPHVVALRFDSPVAFPNTIEVLTPYPLWVP